jgi:beta-lactamase class D
VPAWNRDHDLASAISVSAVWYFQELARRIGRERMQEWIDRAKYGNQNIGGEIDSFWLTGDIRISPVEEVRFLERLYNEDLPFSHRSMEIVKRILIRRQTGDWTEHGKTGWAGEGDNQVGWYVGYVESAKGVWFFADNIHIVKDEDAWARIPLTRAILARELGIGKEE